jgi:EAL domain-containing protein (putative c-di-GMP-specific phosphodiesterase class I)
MKNWHREIRNSALFNNFRDIDLEFSFAFQPIVDVRRREIVSFEALLRGPNGEPSASVFAQVPRHNFSRFDEVCRLKAIYLASQLKIQNRLNLNMSPQSIYEVDLNITATFPASIHSGIPVGNIIFEVLDTENLTDQRHLLKYLRILQDFGFRTAIDDFGAGYSGLNLLVNFQPNYIKLDRTIISNIQHEYIKQCILSGVQQICKDLRIEIIAEGVETADEFHWLNEAGISIFQGYYFARPAFEALPDVANKVFYA